MRDELAKAIAANSPDVSSDDVDELMVAFAAVTNPQSAAMLKQRISQQILRAIEIACIVDPVILDVALNPGLYLGRETPILVKRLTELLQGPPPEALVRHLRNLVLSGAAGAPQKASLASNEGEVLRRQRRKTDALRCLDCGYHFIEGDLGQTRRDIVLQLGFNLAKEQLARRLRDTWKPAAASKLTLDHLVPEAGLGANDPDNLRITCQFCNNEKKIYRWPGEAAPRDIAAALLSLGVPPRGSWAARASTYVAIVDGQGRCSACSRGITEVELTARLVGAGRRSATVPWSMQAVCYECYDPEVG